MFDKGGGHLARQCQGFLGFRVQLSAEHPKGSKGLCVGLAIKLSRSFTLVNLQDV